MANGLIGGLIGGLPQAVLSGHDSECVHGAPQGSSLTIGSNSPQHAIELLVLVPVDTKQTSQWWPLTVTLLTRCCCLC